MQPDRNDLIYCVNACILRRSERAFNEVNRLSFLNSGNYDLYWVLCGRMLIRAVDWSTSLSYCLDVTYNQSYLGTSGLILSCGKSFLCWKNKWRDHTEQKKIRKRNCKCTTYLYSVKYRTYLWSSKWIVSGVPWQMGRNSGHWPQGAP